MRLITILSLIMLTASASLAIVINVPGDYSTIQAAIDAASDGADIHVGAGLYDEVLTINKPIGLYGAGASSTTLTYTDTGALRSQLIMLGANTGAVINGSVTIDGFTFRHDVGLYDDNNLIKFRAESSGGLITISNNEFDQNGTDITAIEETYNAGYFLIDGNTFNCQYAMWFNTAHHGTISNNTLTGSRIGMGGNGAEGMGPRDMVFTYNIIDGPSYGFVMANNVERLDITYNDILNCTSAGVLYWDYGTYYEWGDVHFNYNNFVGNAAAFGNYGTDALPVVVDGTQNWWGDSSGPSGGRLDPITGTPANGSGDLLDLGNLHFDPWYGVVANEDLPWSDVKKLYR